MQEEKTEMKYCLYARKSSEADERQALSTNSQIAEMHEKATREGIKISEVLIENHSAKDAGGREVFNKLLGQIEKGKFNGIITWAPDRLSRNAGDLGSLVDLMDNGKLLEIRTNGQNFTVNPNDKFLLMILCSQAKLENDNKAINVIRGLKNKAKMGIRPGIPPLGYENKRSFVKNGGTIILEKNKIPVILQYELLKTLNPENIKPQRGLSTDTSSAYFSNLFNARKFVKLTDVDGIYENFGDDELPMKKISTGELKDKGITCVDGTLTDFLDSFKMMCYVLNGHNIANIYNFLSGKDCVGTTILPKG